MCDEKQTATKRCKSCGQLLPIIAFKVDSRSKDGHCHICNACKAKGKDGHCHICNACKAKGKEGNPKLAEFTLVN